MARSAWVFNIATAQTNARRINNRLKTLTEKLGSDAPIVEDLTAKLDLLFPGNIAYKNGIPQIVRPAQLAKSNESMEMLAGLEKSAPTWLSVKQSYEKGYEQYVQDESFFGEKVSIEKYIKVNMELPDALTVIYNMFPDPKAEKALTIMQRSGRRKSYDELSRVVNYANSMV